jgi:hypothetical protein
MELRQLVEVPRCVPHPMPASALDLHEVGVLHAGALRGDDLILDALSALGPSVKHAREQGGCTRGPVMEVLEALTHDTVVGAMMQLQRCLGDVSQLVAR